MTPRTSPVTTFERPLDRGVLLSTASRSVPCERRHLSVALALALAFLLALLVYGTRAAPTVLYGDSGEMQTVGLVGGVPHQTGYPAFVLAGYLFRHLGWPDPAYRITFMSCVFGAASVAMMLFLFTELGLSVTVAFAAALTFGGLYTVFLVALRAEVYTLSMFLSLVSLWATVRALRGGRDRDTLLAGFLLGISLTAHLSYGLAAAVLGLALAWQVLVKHRERALPVLVALLGAFVLGLTPYLYLVWADAHRLPLDYFRTADQASNPLGRYDAVAPDPWPRLWHFLMGTGPFPPHPLEVGPREVLRKLFVSVRIVSVYEWGPVGLGLALVGLVRGFRREAALAGLLALLGLVSLGWAVVAGPTVILDLFLLSCLLYLHVFIAWGLAAVAEGLGPWWTGGRAAGAALCLLVPVLVLVPAHGMRHWLDARRIPRLSLQIDYERYLDTRSFFPTLRGSWVARRFGEQALEVIPHGALVVGGWDEIEALRYFQLAEGRRQDLVLWPHAYPNMLLKIGRWQQEHSLRERPVCLLRWYPQLAPRFTAVDSVRLAMGRTLYLAREPMRDLDGP